jgi:lipoate-protein ligase A
MEGRNAVTRRLLDLTLGTPEENLALDEALLLEAERAAAETAADGGAASATAIETLRLWESPTYFVAVGVSGRLGDEVRMEACRADRVPFLRRASGGGTVLQGPGCLSFALVLALEDAPALLDIHASYDAILSRVAAALGVPGVLRRGISDLVAGDLKFSGNAQKRKRRTLLHHGTVLYDFDLARIERYLAEPPAQPEYRRGRPHRSFVANVPLSAAEIRTRLARAWNAAPPAAPCAVPDLAPLIAEKYGNREWHEKFL